MVLSEYDRHQLCAAIDKVKVARSMQMKGRVDLTLENGIEASVYHLGTSNSTIRIDLKGATDIES